MNRDDIKDKILKVPNTNILCELPTGVGKTKIALDFIKSKFLPDQQLSVLVVIPRLVLIDNWKDEFKKWDCADYLPYTEFVTYVSFPKKAGNYSIIVYDECHHLSERCREALTGFKAQYNLLLSATVGMNMRYELKDVFPNLYTCHITARTAISENILPDPKVYLIPLTLDNQKVSCEIIKNKSQKREIRIPYAKEAYYSKVKNMKIIIQCTQQQYYNHVTMLIEWYRRKMQIPAFKNRYLHACGERLKWLSNQKTEAVKYLLSLFNTQRTLTFCNSIKQTEELGEYCINSKNKESKEYIDKFNNGEIDHITSCEMLNEGVNLVDCKVGIYASLNSSDKLIIQKLGRLLRHPEPVIVIPYFKNTRDEEIVEKMMKDYNPKLVTTITNLNQLKV